MVTDGLTEVTDRRERELGLEGIESALAAHAEEPLERLFEEILGRVRAHGPQRDDQTLLLVRMLDRCKLANPEDRAGRHGAGPRYWVGDRRPA